MKTTSAKLKRRAKAKLKGRYGSCVGAELVATAIVVGFIIMFFFILFFIAAASDMFYYSFNQSDIGTVITVTLFFVIYILFLVVMALMGPGLLRFYYNLAVEKNPEISNLLFGVKNVPLKFLALYGIQLIVGLVCAIPYIVVMIAGVITDFIPIMAVLLVLMYILMLAGVLVINIYMSQSMFILLESTDKGVIQSIMESVQMMKGSKGRLFYLYLSFTGMIILGYCSAYIGFLWIFPYMRTTLTEFYLDLKAQQAKKVVEQLADPSFESMWNQEKRQ